ncbi:alpha-hydroxy acid oxidase [Burkholderia cepacia]|uniref:alpha-hydroxy acid oxidase n=1 Tax=Burkholderia cepacia TaxID=292 RepID=UPI001CF3625C|nr:alpha-hydroxy acid oxidase [Burkholderia cepacia]MCA8031005.1 alpha-hydroxy-acid oxidizing protein [Burkholderia cepacia]
MKRHLYLGSDLARVQTIEELRMMALRRLPAFAWQYIESGSEDEVTLHRNRRVLQQIAFVPSTLVDTSQRRADIDLFGMKLAAPVVVAPTGFNGLAFPGGDSALARAAAANGVPFTLSSFSNESIEAVGPQGSMNWCQLYLLEDFRITERLVARAREAGFKALVITTDANVVSSREWQKRCYRVPGKLTCSHLSDAAIHLHWMYNYLRNVAMHGEPIFANLEEFFPRQMLWATRAAPLITGQLKPRITWDDVKRIRAQWDGPLLIKGVMSQADAIRAKQTGADGIVISNHGGRQLDCAVSPMEVLPSIRERLPDFTILVDSGFRRGSDVLKAVARGADAVMIGRATLYGLAAAGEAGASHALKIITNEIHRTMGLLGCSDLASVANHIFNESQSAAATALHPDVTSLSGRAREASAHC